MQAALGATATVHGSSRVVQLDIHIQLQIWVGFADHRCSGGACARLDGAGASAAPWGGASGTRGCASAPPRNFVEHGKGAGGVQTAAVTASADSWKHTPDAGAGAALNTEPGTMAVTSSASSTAPRCGRWRLASDASA